MENNYSSKAYCKSDSVIALKQQTSDRIPTRTMKIGHVIYVTRVNAMHSMCPWSIFSSILYCRLFAHHLCT